jgi:hypothetical protein
MLNYYTQQTQLLLKDPKMERFNLFDLRSYVNTARGQVALEGECIRIYSTLTLAIGTQQYPFSAIVFPAGALGVAGVMNVRMATYQIAGGAKRITTREWEYFNEFVLNNPVPNPGPPVEWAQYGQGAAGSLFFNLPDFGYTLNLDTVGYPLPLASDTDPEALPYAWTDAVPYYAAYVGLLTAQQADAAAGMYKLYELFAGRARQFATPSVLPHQYQQTPDPTMAGRLGVTMQRGAAA